MSSPNPLPDPLSDRTVELAQELAQLQREEREVSQKRWRLFDRIDRGATGSTNEWLRKQEREISGRRRELHARIDALRAEQDALYLASQLRHLGQQIDANPPDGETADAALNRDATIVPDAARVT